MKYLLIAIAICCLLTCHAQDNDLITTEILLDHELLEELSIDVKFINSFEFTPDGFILLSSPEQFYILGIGGMVSVFKDWNIKNRIESFAITEDSILLVISGHTLYQTYSDPPFIKATDIPDSGMGITSKYKEIYVYDKTQKADKDEYSIYEISEEENTSIITASTPILSVFELPSFLIFSSKNTLFCVDKQTKNIYPIYTLPKEDDIISIVSDTINHAFYFSTSNAIYRIKENKIELISDDFGGILRYDGEGLLIFNPEKQLIVRLRNNLLYPVVNDTVIHGK